MNDIILRRFNPKDQTGVSELYRSGISNYSYNGPALIAQCYDSFIVDKLKPEGDMSNIQSHYINERADGKKSCFWVAVDGDKVVGCIGAVPTTKYNEDHIELVRMYVSSDHRKHNIGSRLVALLESWAKSEGFHFIYLSTIAALVESNIFYPKNGFKLMEAEEFDVSAAIGAASPAIVVGNHYVKTIA